MSKTNLTIGERVSLIPFKHKGKAGEVKYIGEIDGKAPGIWIGIELDEPKGDSDGEFNGIQLYECRPSHGVVLRPS
jgi:dynactin complex subunit